MNEFQRVQEARYALCDSGSHEFKSFDNYVCCNYCGKEPVMTDHVTAENLVRSYASAYGDVVEPVADYNGIHWMEVGHNASHSFELGWDDDNRLFKRSYGEGFPQVDADHEPECKRDPVTCYCTILVLHTSEVEIANPGYVGHH